MKNLALLFLCILISSQFSTGQVSYTFTTIDAPGASATQVRGINNAGETVGIYTDANTGLIHGFYMNTSGGFKHIDFPGAVQTYPRDINSSGHVAGFFTDAAGAFHGFFFADGIFHRVDVQGSPGDASRGLNDQDQIVGDYLDVNGINDHAYEFTKGQFTTFDFPGAIFTVCSGINNSGLRVGTYSLDGAITMSFRLKNGQFNTVVVGGSHDTEILGLNNLGDSVGFYFNGTSNTGFLLSNGTVTVIDVPGAFGTVVRSINDNGVIVGNYTTNGVQHGFIGTPSSSD